jgi:hypothetical protein
VCTPAVKADGLTALGSAVASDGNRDVSSSNSSLLGVQVHLMHGHAALCKACIDTSHRAVMQLQATLLHASSLISTHVRRVKLCLPDQLRSELVNAVATQ